MSDQSSPAPVSQQEQIEYRDIPGFSGYRVGSDGTIWTCKNNRWGKSSFWHLLKASLDSCGYLYVGLRDAFGRTKRVRIHVLVMRSFIGEVPGSMEVLHGNGIRTDNRLVNLSWGTRQENCNDTVRHGRTTRGEKNIQAKLTEQDVSEILRRLNSGEGAKALAEEFGVSTDHVQTIQRGRHWWWLQGKDAPVLPQKSRAKLEATDIPIIRSLLASGMSQGQVAQRFGVARSTIESIAHEKTWKHVS